MRVVSIFSSESHQETEQVYLLKGNSFNLQDHKYLQTDACKCIHCSQKHTRAQTR